MNRADRLLVPDEWGALQLDTRPLSWNISTLFFGPRLYKLFPALVYLHMLSFQIKPSQGGAGPVRCVSRLDYAELHTEGGIWRCFSWQITAGPLRVLCLPSSSRASLTELLPCWLATLETPPGIDWALCEGREKDKEENGRGKTKDRRRKRERKMNKGCERSILQLVEVCRWNASFTIPKAACHFLLCFSCRAQLYNVQFFQCSEEGYCQVSTSIYLIVFFSVIA